MSDDAAPDTGAAKTPADFLKSIRGKPVVVKLNSGVDYRGILACLDGYMNIAMEQTEVRSSSRSRLTRSTRASRSNDASKAPSGRARAPIADAPPNPKISRHSCVDAAFASPARPHAASDASLTETIPAPSFQLALVPGVRERSAEEQVRRRVHPRQQRALHLDGEGPVT